MAPCGGGLPCRSLPVGPGAYEVCPVCLWEDEGSPDGPYGVGGPNGYSLVYGQRRYLREHRAHDDSPPHFCARPAREGEPRDPAWAPHPDILRNDLVLGWSNRRLIGTWGCMLRKPHEGDAQVHAARERGDNQERPAPSVR